VQFLFSPDLAELMANHPGINSMVFAGRTEIGQKLFSITAPNLKPVQLQLSVKNSCLILEDADSAAAAKLVVEAAFTHSGQSNEAISRVMVKESKQQEFIEALDGEIKKLKFGNPKDLNTTYGCLLALDQKPQLQSHISSAVHEKGKLLQPMAVDHPQAISPTVIYDLHNCSDLHQIDLFGPTLIIVGTKYLHESIKWANTTPYGYSAMMIGQDHERLEKAAKQLNVENVWFNDWRPQDLVQPFVGRKLSGCSSSSSCYGYVPSRISGIGTTANRN